MNRAWSAPSCDKDWFNERKRMTPRTGLSPGWHSLSTLYMMPVAPWHERWQMLHWAGNWGMNGQLYEMVTVYKTSITLFAQAKTRAM